MAKRIEPGYVPNMDDCKMIVKCQNGATCYVMDTCCRNMTKEDKARIDAQIMNIYIASEMRKRRRDSGTL